MRAVVFAYHDIGCVGIESLLTSEFEVPAVFTHEDDPAESRFFRSVVELCSVHQLPVFNPKKVNQLQWIDRIRALKLEIIFSFYYRNIICDQILEIPPLGGFNLHGSLLPRYRGRCPGNWALINGEVETGVTLHKMVERADAGAIVVQQRVLIDPQDTGLTLHQKLVNASRELLTSTLNKFITGSVTLEAQDESQASYYGSRTPADGVFDWKRSATELNNLIRAISKPYPGAFCFIGNRKLIVLTASADDDLDGNTASPGTILSTNPLQIECGQGRLTIQTGSLDNISLQAAQLVAEARLKVGQLCTRAHPEMLFYSKIPSVRTRHFAQKSNK